ncbi:hypothetical protein H5J24_04955 [Chryseobacterium capnotolerans]|uniref:hypothetical protein n=1 Tax=Chryseobacterium TaxID=59732 RepID=UPI00083A967A|nr:MULTISPECIES: hypothetical protein [Chryseobacterium]UHO39452.1 hypothetical protein H5J24_04955 [Chryseobacterium capnotolerans]
MNWVIRSTKKVQFHTNLKEVLKPIWGDLIHYRWILTDLDFISDQPLPINFDRDFFDLDYKEFEQLYQSNTQIIWGIISAIPNHVETDTSLLSILSAEDMNVWKSNHFSIQEGILEIIAFDSGYTLVKFKDKKLSDTFKEYFQEQAIDLDRFNAKYIS